MKSSSQDGEAGAVGKVGSERGRAVAGAVTSAIPMIAGGVSGVAVPAVPRQGPRACPAEVPASHPPRRRAKRGSPGATPCTLGCDERATGVAPETWRHDGHGRRQRAGAPRRKAAAVGETSPTRYRFGPLERRGLVAGWRGGQIGAVAAACRWWAWPWCACSVLRGRAGHGVVPAAGDRRRGGDVADRGPNGGTVGSRRLSVTPSPGRHGGAPGRARSPACVSSGSTWRRWGATRPRPGRASASSMTAPAWTVTAVLGASDPGFVLLSEDDKARRVGVWSRCPRRHWHATVRRCTGCNGSSAVVPAQEKVPAVTVPPGAGDAGPGYGAAHVFCTEPCWRPRRTRRCVTRCCWG